jgi:pyridoxine kinase
MAVLSIQSHVVYGYAGNTAAVFPLQRLGNEVWAVNTVEFSNHTGYGSWKGKVLGECTAVLSGYLGDASIGMAVVSAVKKVKNKNPSALYCCDPVMGDTGRGFYVKPDIPGIFRDELLPLADITTPNQFEIEAITGVNTNNIDNILTAVNILTGDITAAIFLSRYLETRDLKKTLEICAASVYGVLEISYNKYIYKGKNSPCELKIIDAQNELCSPSNSFESEKL